MQGNLRLILKSYKKMAEVYLPFQKVTEFIVILICRSTHCGVLKGMAVLDFYEVMCDSKKSNNTLESRIKVR